MSLEPRRGGEPDEARLDEAGVPAPDPALEPSGFTVDVDTADRIHFLDWGDPGDRVYPAPGVLLIHGLAGTAWAWAPAARRIGAVRHTVAMDLRGHGLSDAPTHGYDPFTLTADAIAVAEGGGLLGGDAPGAADGSDRVVLAGHGFGAIVAAWAAASLGERCAGLVLVDGGWEDIGTSTGMAPDEFLKTIEEPPEVLRSMRAYLADRRGYDPATWDADQERAARAAIVELPAGHVVSSTRPHALAGAVEAMLGYRPIETLATVRAPVTALVAADDEDGSRSAAFEATRTAVIAGGGPSIAVHRFPALGHNLMRYRPAAVVAAILSVAAPVPG
ncbi:MAG: alpha/beta fold hydrolase [Candidatus Limnocylindrales bacterium]